MNRYKPAFFVTAVLLLASLFWHWRRSAPTEPIAPVPTATATQDPDRPDLAQQVAVELRAAQAEVLRLRADLDRCQDRAWEMAGDILQGEVAGFDEVGEATDDDGRVCALSQALLRKQWREAEPRMREALGRDLGSEAWVDNDLEWRLGRLRERFDLASRDAEALERGYRGIWDRHGERMRAQAAEGDWEGVADTVRAFWREEDEIVGQVLRDDELATFSKSQASLRTGLLAMFATYSDRPWSEESLSW